LLPAFFLPKNQLGVLSQKILKRIFMLIHINQILNKQTHFSPKGKYLQIKKGKFGFRF